MKRYSIHTYGSSYSNEVARLMAEARTQRRKDFPLLPNGLSDRSTAAKILASTVTDGGVVALSEDGELAGFLFAERRESSEWGPAVVVDVDQWAIASGMHEGVLVKMYAAGFESKTSPLTGTLVPEHRVYCPASDQMAINTWFKLGFGMEQAYAAASLECLDSEYIPIVDVEIRLAQPGDEDVLSELSPLIAIMQAQPPIWAGAPASYLTDLRNGFRELATDKNAIVLLAFRGGKAVGYQAWFPVSPHPLDGVTEGAIELSVGATIPEERGSGIGRALTARGVSEARKAGYSVCFTDWRTTNPLSSAFWPARGFKPFLYRLVRRINPLTV